MNIVITVLRISSNLAGFAGCVCPHDVATRVRVVYRDCHVQYAVSHTRASLPVAFGIKEKIAIHKQRQL